MFEAGYESYEKNDKKGLGRGAMSWKECEDEGGHHDGEGEKEREGGAKGSTSLSPHHEGYDAEVVARQRRELLKATTAAAAARTGPTYLEQDELKARSEERGKDGVPAMGGAGVVEGGEEEDPNDNKGGSSSSSGGGIVSGGGGGGGGGGGEGGKVAANSGSSSSSSDSNTSLENWTWAKPSRLSQEQEEQQSNSTRSGSRTASSSTKSRLGHIPVVLRTLLTPAEVVQSLTELGGGGVTSVDIRGKGNFDAEAMIFASGRSGGHLRRMADALVGALKARGVEEERAPGVTGAEGYECDDWMIVDGGNVIVHLMEPSQRKALELEQFWGGAAEGMEEAKGGSVGEVVMPVVAGTSEAAWNQAHDELLERFPCDEGYAPENEGHSGRERELRRVLGGQRGFTGRRARRRA
ncbi:iojap-like ribosome-associated protein [Nannochloropsis oceanica]